MRGAPLADGQMGAGVLGPDKDEGPAAGALEFHYLGAALGQQLSATATSDFFQFIFLHDV